LIHIYDYAHGVLGRKEIMKMQSRYTEVHVQIDERSISCLVSRRWLDQVAKMDDLHTDDDYSLIAQQNLTKIEAAARRLLSSRGGAVAITLERSDFPVRP
jgi:hypothetical protein